jgi:uncharacterized phage-like protein YoqJ
MFKDPTLRALPRDAVIGVTGHRPSRLWGDSKIDILAGIRATFRECKPTMVNIGMAIGFDTLVAKTCIQMHIPFVAYIPFEGQENKWSNDDQKKYRDYLEHAETIICVSKGGYSAQKMMLRNLEIVDNSQGLLAYWDEARQGGTWNAIQAADEINLPIYNLRPDVKSFQNRLTRI